MGKSIDLQPWLAYFEMLRQYRDKGFLEMQPDKHAAYITRAALYSLATRDGDDKFMMVRILGAVKNIRAYAAFLSMQGKPFINEPFALHAVGEDEPHGLIFTILLTRRRAWWKLWMGMADRVEMIDYRDNGQP